MRVLTHTGIDGEIVESAAHRCGAIQSTLLVGLDVLSGGRSPSQPIHPMDEEQAVMFEHGPMVSRRTEGIPNGH